MIASKKNAQSGFEFLVISMAVLTFFTIFFIAIQTTTEERSKEKENLIIKNLALSVQDEINIASEASNGYSRTFYVPVLILGKSYDIKIIDNSIYIKTERNALSLQVKDLEGQIQKGANLIKKQDGKVYLN